MHIKFLKHGTGSGAKAAQYVLVDTKSLGKEILDGNPEQFSAVTDSLDFVHRYRSAVITWSREDEPTPEQIRETLNGFYDVAFAGLDRDRFSPLAVLHTSEDGRKDMHVLIPRVDLETGKSYNPAPPGWQKRYDPLRDMLNYKHDWSRPDDSLRKRSVNLNAPEHIDRKTAKEQITDWLIQRINAGLVTDRKSVIDSLREIGEINRQGKDYVSVKLPDFDKPIRLKGGIYEEQFSPKHWAEIGAVNERRCGVDREEQRRRFESAQQEFRKSIERTARFNQEKYGEVEFRADITAQKFEHSNHTPTLTSYLDDVRPACVDVRGDLGCDAVSDRQDFEQSKNDRGEQARDTESSEQVSRSVNTDQRGRATATTATTAERKEVDDTDRAAVDAIVAAVARVAEEAKRIAVATVSRVDRAIEWLVDHVAGRADSARNFSSASAHIEQSGSELEQSVKSFGKIIDRFDTEGISQKIAVVIRPDLAPKQSRGFGLGD